MSNERWLSEVQDVVSKLKFLSKLQPGEKIQVNSLSIIENGWFWKVYRHFTSKGKTEKDILESREISLNSISELCEIALKLALDVVDKEGTCHQEVWTMVLSSLKEFQPGIRNLMVSYEGDRLFISKVDTFISILNAKIKELEEMREKVFANENSEIQ
jgi:hypothetical protein